MFGFDLGMLLVLIAVQAPTPFLLKLVTGGHRGDWAYHGASIILPFVVSLFHGTRCRHRVGYWAAFISVASVLSVFAISCVSSWLFGYDMKLGGFADWLDSFIFAGSIGSAYATGLIVVRLVEGYQSAEPPSIAAIIAHLIFPDSADQKSITARIQVIHSVIMVTAGLISGIISIAAGLSRVLGSG